MFRNYALVLILICCSCTKNGTNTPSISLPVLSSVTVDFIDKRSDAAAAMASVISSGGTPVIQKGVAWSNSPNATINSGNKIISQSGDSAMRENIRGLAINKTYYLRAFATNDKGTAYSNEISFKIPVDVNWRDSSGAYIFYLFKEGEPGFIKDEIHGLMTTGDPVIPRSIFSCNNSILLGTATGIGTGKSNTEKLINIGIVCNDPISWSPTILYSLAKNLKDLNEKKWIGYTDWFIPSKDEFLKLIEFSVNYKVMNQLYSIMNYWTSSESNATSAFGFNQNLTGIAEINKGGSSKYAVPIRSF